MRNKLHKKCVHEILVIFTTTSELGFDSKA